MSLPPSKLSALPPDTLKAVQAALIKLGHLHGAADGIFGPLTLGAWASFKRSIHLGEPDLISQASLDSLQKAAAEVKGKVHDFSTKAGTIAAIRWECNAKGLTLKTQHAYVVATVDHETAGSFRPVEEGYYLGPRAKNFQKKLRYYPYFGRGYVQLTWHSNYQKYSNILGVNLVANPELACDPNIALFVLVHGFKNGTFTGAALERYVNAKKTDFVNARRVINGTDRAAHIAKLAQNYLRSLP
jgi:predicted chitinase